MISGFVCFVTYAHKSPLVCAASVFRGFTLWKIHFLKSKVFRGFQGFALFTMFCFTPPVFFFILIGSVLFQERTRTFIFFCKVHKISGKAFNKPWENQPSIHLLYYLPSTSSCSQGAGGLLGPLRGAVGRRQGFTPDESKKMIHFQRKMGNRSQEKQIQQMFSYWSWEVFPAMHHFPK